MSMNLELKNCRLRVASLGQYPLARVVFGRRRVRARASVVVMAGGLISCGRSAGDLTRSKFQNPDGAPSVLRTYAAEQKFFRLRKE